MAAPARPAYDPAKGDALIKDLADRSKQKAAKFALMKLGKSVVPQLHKFMLSKDQELTKAPKAKKYGHYLPLKNALFACYGIGKPCTSALQALVKQTKSDALKTIGCSVLKKLGAPCK